MRERKATAGAIKVYSFFTEALATLAARRRMLFRVALRFCVFA